MLDETPETPVVPATEEITPPAPSQSPVKDELEKEQNRAKSDKEKAEKNLFFNAQRVKELGGDPAQVLGIDIPQGASDDDTPVTVGMLKARDVASAKQTALQMTDNIIDENERNLTREYLTNRIVPSGNAEADFRLALAAVSSVKNGQIAIMTSQRSSTRRTASGGSADPSKEDRFEATPEELVFMAPPYNLSKEKIIANRKARKE